MIFSKKTKTPSIDPEQLELIKNAQHRIKQKKRFYTHLALFIIGVLVLIIANILLGIGKRITFFGAPISYTITCIWSFVLLYHAFYVFIIHKFLGKKWQQEQLNKLVAKQQQRIQQLNKSFSKEEILKAESKSYAESLKPKKELTIIVAAGENNAIGKDNKLIWHLKDDLKRFKALTSGHCIIMGRKTFQSFPKPLPNRTHIVITNQTNYSAPQGVVVVNSLEEAINAAKDDVQPFIIGGGEVYKQAIQLADKIEITRVHESFEADTFFPNIDTAIWKESSNQFHPKDANHPYDFSFITYKRR